MSNAPRNTNVIFGYFCVLHRHKLLHIRFLISSCTNLVSLINSISIFVGYFMQNPSFLKNSSEAFNLGKCLESECNSKTGVRTRLLPLLSSTLSISLWGHPPIMYWKGIYTWHQTCDVNDNIWVLVLIGLKSYLYLSYRIRKKKSACWVSIFIKCIFVKKI